MIFIQMPLKREDVIGLLNGATHEGFTFHYLKQEKMKLYFEVDGDQREAAKTVEKVIKTSTWGSALYYQVSYEE